MKKKTTLKVVKSCRKKGCGSACESWETMIGKTFENKRAA